MESSHHFHFSQIFSSLYLKGIICFHFDIIYTGIFFFIATLLYSSESNVIFIWIGIGLELKMDKKIFFIYIFKDWLQQMN